MKIGVMPPMGTPVATGAYIRRVAAAAEDLGFHSLWVPEHVVLFDEYRSRYPYSADGRLAVGPGRGIIDPFLALTAAAAATERIRLGTGICLVPQRNPVYTAKAVASLDWLSGGRFDFGVGIGWLREEFEALAVPWARRAQRTMEYLELMRRLWEDEVAEYHGELYDMGPVRQDPKPVQRPHPPIHFGGESDAALRRVARAGQGWYGFSLDPEGTAERIGHLTSLLEEHGRTRAAVEVSICPGRGAGAPGRELVEAYAAAGADQVIFITGGRDADDAAGRLEELARAVL
jgi:probable F420-dependent oxidoreductase